jgi:hypothetical protein
METIKKYNTSTLEGLKVFRYDEVDIKTEQLIGQGFTYATKVFSLSSNAQTNILALDNTKDDPALTYPISYNTIDDLDSYDIADSTDLHNMYLTALTTVRGHQDSGTVLKTQIRDAIDIAAINTIIDNR